MTAFGGDKIVGHCHLVYANEEKTEIRLCFVVVDDKERGKGYGEKLVKAAVKYSILFLGADTVSLRVYNNNPGAKKCYEKCGFVPRENGHSLFEYKDWKWGCTEMIFTL